MSHQHHVRPRRCRPSRSTNGSEQCHQHRAAQRRIEQRDARILGRELARHDLERRVEAGADPSASSAAPCRIAAPGRTTSSMPAIPATTNAQRGHVIRSFSTTTDEQDHERGRRVVDRRRFGERHGLERVDKNTATRNQHRRRARSAAPAGACAGAARASSARARARSPAPAQHSAPRRAAARDSTHRKDT